MARQLRNWTRRQMLGACALAGWAQDKEWRRVPRGMESESKSPALAALLGELGDALERERSRSLIRHIGKDFRVDWEGGSGPEDFQARWMGRKGSAELRAVLRRLLRMRGHFYTDHLFVLPDVYALFPMDLDPQQHVVATAETKLLRGEGEESRSEVVPEGGILELWRGAESSGEAIRVKDLDGAAAEVARADVYSPLGYRAFFEKRAGEWRWISLVAGGKLKASSRVDPA